MFYFQEIPMLLDLTDSLNLYVKENLGSMSESIWGILDFLMAFIAGQQTIRRMK